MQARLEMRRFPLTFIAVALAMAVALLVGLGIGYAIKIPTITTGPARVVVATQSSTAGDDSCILVNQHKAC
jgi:hypothetical protein